MNTLVFRNKILMWYSSHKRDLPWRIAQNPYQIWVSEIILQQTRIDQGLAYYHRFIEKYPTLNHLVKANEDDILKIWQGLGYYSRARNMLKAASQLNFLHNGMFPKTSKELKNIPGIGEYTAAAIASIAFNEPVAAIDGNVFRVLARIFGIETPIDSTQGLKEFKILSNELICKLNPGDYNQAVMEFGALHCTPKKPNCHHCIFVENCMAFNLKIVDKLPIKSKKIKITNRYIYYFITEQKEHIYICKRENKDIWQNLYDFPSIETSTALQINDLVQLPEWENIFKYNTIEIKNISKIIVHVLTHQKIHTCFITISLLTENNLPSNFIKIKKRDIFDLAVPKLIENYINENSTFFLL